MRGSRIFHLIFILLLYSSMAAYATHLRAGEITVKRKDCNSLTFLIIIKVYTNTGSTIKYDGGVLDFGDRTARSIRPRIDNTILGVGIGFVKDSVEHTYSGGGQFIITYEEPNRNEGILNMSNSVFTRFFLQTSIVIDALAGCDNSPQLSVPPIDRGCSGAAWFHNPGAYDVDGDSLSYELTVPKQGRGVDVGNYQDPNDESFYTNHSTGNEMRNEPPTFTIDSKGTIRWDAPGLVGQYNIAFRIYQWKRVGSQWARRGYVTRDMQIIIEDCLNQRPLLIVPPQLCVVAETIPPIKELIVGSDPDNHPVKIEAFSEVFPENFAKPSPATRTPFPAVFSASPAQLTFNWATICQHVKDQFYQVVFKISDMPPRGPSLVNFGVLPIRVMGPKPILNPVVPDVNNRSVTLNWQPYKCAIPAVSMEVWRRVGSFAGTQAECDTGMPPTFGYTKIKTFPIATITYKDEGLAAGATYCYRLVAVFPQGGGFSKVSDEQCMMTEFKLDRPVVTNVSIDKTSTTAGQITISWTPPLDLPAQQFGYEVYRADGFSGKININKVSPGNTITATTYQDEGMDTENKIYNYRVLAYDAVGAKLDSSAVASTVRLEIASKFQELELRWVASVPWSNSVSGQPHRVYRKLEGEDDLQFVKIADVNPGAGFVYADKGLDNAKRYCYRVETVGSYGNPAIPTPLFNYSQIVCAQPDDKIPPCQPKFSVSLKGTDCTESETCIDVKTFTNKISWEEPEPSCKEDVKGYIIYYASKVGGEFIKLNDKSSLVTGLEFEHKNLPSFAGCYKIQAVDRGGNESELSTEFCFDNCPYYELPNVFTPNGDKCNDKFSAFNARNIVVSDGGAITSECGSLTAAELELIKKKCARFVDKVYFTVYNRWGAEVFKYESGGEKTIYIDWDGRDNSGVDLASGVYFYEAQVAFNVVDPAKRNQNIRGWVQIVR